MTDELIQKLSRLLETKLVLDKLKEKVREDFDYFCHDEINCYETAAKQFEEALNQHIDERISKFLFKE